MKMWNWVVGVGVLSAALALSGCGDGEGTGRPQGSGTKPAGGVAQKTCPVMGQPINTAISVDHNGRRVYFCCEACIATFKKEPEKYLKKLDEQLKSAPKP